MQKVYVSLIFVSVLAYGVHEKKESSDNRSPLEAGILQQLRAKRPAEQDIRKKYTIPSSIPSIGGKQLEINMSQLVHLSKALGGVALTCYAGNLHTNTQTDDYKWFADVETTYHTFLAMLLFTTLCSVNSSYKYFNGQQKNPFTIVDAPETVSTEKSNS